MKNIKNLKDLFFNLKIEKKLFDGTLEYIKSKYNIDEFREVFNITPWELKYLQDRIDTFEDKIQLLKDFIDKEISQTDLEDKLVLINDEINTIDSDIKNNNTFQKLYSLVLWDYKNIPDWDDYLNIWDINDVKTFDVINNKSNDFSWIISDMIWFNDYNNLSMEQKDILNMLFSNIRNFHIETNIFWYWEIKDFLEVYEKEFISYIQEKLKDYSIK